MTSEIGTKARRPSSPDCTLSFDSMVFLLTASLCLGGARRGTMTTWSLRWGL